MGTVPKKARSQKRRKSVVLVKGAGGEERQIESVSNVQASSNVNMVLSNPFKNNIQVL